LIICYQSGTGLPPDFDLKLRSLSSSALPYIETCFAKCFANFIENFIAIYIVIFIAAFKKRSPLRSVTGNQRAI